jgi:hypothetical protein
MVSSIYTTISKLCRHGTSKATTPTSHPSSRCQPTIHQTITTASSIQPPWLQPDLATSTSNSKSSSDHFSRAVSSLPIAVHLLSAPCSPIPTTVIYPRLPHHPVTLFDHLHMPVIINPSSPLLPTVLWSPSIIVGSPPSSFSAQLTVRPPPTTAIVPISPLLQTTSSVYNSQHCLLPVTSSCSHSRLVFVPCATPDPYLHHTRFQPAELHLYMPH